MERWGGGERRGKSRDVGEKERGRVSSVHVYVKSAIETKHCKATTPEEGQLLSLEKKICCLRCLRRDSYL